MKKSCLYLAVSIAYYTVHPFVLVIEDGLTVTAAVSLAEL